MQNSWNRREPDASATDALERLLALSDLRATL
jgi:hypothetical protein